MSGKIERVFKCAYKQVKEIMCELNDFDELFKALDGFHLSPTYSTCGENCELIGGVGMSFEFDVATEYGVMRMTMFKDDNGTLSLWEYFEYHPTATSGMLTLLEFDFD